jgi:WD40 repeat protein
LLACLAGKLELLSEKTKAHSDAITSVAFSPDGTKIVSGSFDKTIKVWDSGALEPSKSPLLGQHWRLLACLAGKLELLSEKVNAHSDVIATVAFSPDGSKIVSGSVDETIKVWDSGAPRPWNGIRLAKTDVCWLVWQANWSW